MKLTEPELQEIKTFLEENLCQEIDIRLIHAITWHEVLSKFFYDNLNIFIAPDTSKVVRDWVNSLQKKEKRKFKIIPFLLCRVN